MPLLPTPWEIDKAVKVVREFSKNKILGIHSHNDSDLGVANALQAVLAGANQIQGTINGYGERCGNANLCSIIANLNLKMNIECIKKENLDPERNGNGYRLIANTGINGVQEVPHLHFHILGGRNMGVMVSRR